VPVTEIFIVLANPPSIIEKPKTPQIKKENKMASSFLQAKGVIVTGGGSGEDTTPPIYIEKLGTNYSKQGINHQLTKYLHKQGCKILIADIGIHRDASQWVEEVATAEDATAAFLKVDVTDWAALEGMFEFFAERFGHEPDIVVLGAGVYEASTAGFWDDTDESSHYKLFDINLSHPIKATRIAIRRLRRAQKPGVILHLSSIAAQKPSVVLPLYSVSKLAISQFVRCMAPLEDMCGIRVVAVAPG